MIYKWKSFIKKKKVVNIFSSIDDDDWKQKYHWNCVFIDESLLLLLLLFLLFCIIKKFKFIFSSYLIAKRERERDREMNGKRKLLMMMTMITIVNNGLSKFNDYYSIMAEREREREKEKKSSSLTVECKEWEKKFILATFIMIIIINNNNRKKIDQKYRIESNE